MLVWLGTYICNWLSIWLAIFLCLVVTFRPRFHSDYLTPSATALSKRLTMVQMFLLNCLPSRICVLKHVRTRLIILTGSKNYYYHKIKIAETGQSAVGSRQSAFTPWTANVLFIISEILSTCRGGRGGGEKEGMEVKWASHYYIYFINKYYAGGLSSFISLLISFVSFFQICNSLFSICQVYTSFFSLPIHP